MQVLVFLDRSVTEDLLVRMVSPQDLLILLAKSSNLGCEVCMFLTEGRCQHVNTAMTSIWPARNELSFVVIYSRLGFCVQDINWLSK